MAHETNADKRPAAAAVSSDSEWDKRPTINVDREQKKRARNDPD